MTKFNNTGVTSPPFSGGGQPNPYAIAINASGNVWSTNFNNSYSDTTVAELTSAGMPVSTEGFSVGTAQLRGIAIDGSGNVWAANYLDNMVVEFIGAATPVVTPLAANLAAPYSAPASKP